MLHKDLKFDSWVGSYDRSLNEMELLFYNGCIIIKKNEMVV